MDAGVSAADTYLSAGAIAHAEERRRAAPRPLTWYEGGGTRGDRLSARTRGSPLIPTARGAIIREVAEKGSGREYPQRALGGNKSAAGACPGGVEREVIARDETPASGGWMPAIGLPEGIPAPSPPPPPQREGKRWLLRGKALAFAWESVGIA